MCQACIEAELWLAYQEEVAAKRNAPPDPAAVSPSSPPAAAASAPDRPAPPFACEEPPAS